MPYNSVSLCFTALASDVVPPRQLLGEECVTLTIRSPTTSGRSVTTSEPNAWRNVQCAVRGVLCALTHRRRMAHCVYNSNLVPLFTCTPSM